MEWNVLSVDQDLCNNFSNKKIIAAFKTLKAGKAPGPDNLHRVLFIPWWKKLWVVVDTVLKLPIHKEAFKSVANGKTGS